MIGAAPFSSHVENKEGVLLSTSESTGSSSPTPSQLAGQWTHPAHPTHLLEQLDSTLQWTVDMHPIPPIEWHSTKTDQERNSVSPLTHKSGIQLTLWVSGNIALTLFTTLGIWKYCCRKAGLDFKIRLQMSLQMVFTPIYLCVCTSYHLHCSPRFHPASE